MSTKVFLVDDHPMLREGVRQALTRRPDLRVVGEASTGAAAFDKIRETSPDLVIMDFYLPDMNGIEVTRRILADLPSAKVVIFSGDATRTLVDEALHAGACGYIWKQCPIEELIRAIEMVMSGKLYLSPEVSVGILEDYRKSLVEESVPPKASLSERDKQLLRLVAEGRRNKEIAEQLGVTSKSVEAYRSRLMKRLGFSSSADLVRYAIREGIAVP